jgi:hypothetical protein
MPSMVTLRQVNDCLRAEGHKERLVRSARGYFYFHSGKSGCWPAASVYVYRLSAMSLDGWMAEFHRLRADSYDEDDAADSRSVLEVKQ